MKNFQLVEEDEDHDKANVILQFGKVSLSLKRQFHTDQQVSAFCKGMPGLKSISSKDSFHVAHADLVS